MKTHTIQAQALNECRRMSMRPTPLLSERGSREVEEEMKRPPADTPQRRRMWELADRMKPYVDRIMQPKPPAESP